jgi:UDP-2,3-diacylglucosamine pyrophosphatase LpxH
VDSADATGSSPAVSEPASLLVVSDLHLHVGSRPEVVTDLVRLLAAQREDLLVINGDLFDLDQVPTEPQAGEGIARALKRLSGTLDLFPEIGRALQAWTARGGRIVWLPGNHDAELCHPDIQRLLRQRLALSENALRFETDRFTHEGVVIEHGHQQDPDNRFYPDTATAISKNRLSAFPLGCLTTRFLMCRIPAFVNREENHQAPLAVLMTVIRNHGWSTPGMVARYILAGLLISRQAAHARRREDADPQTTMYGASRVLHRMYMDRVLLTVALGIFLLVLLMVRLVAPAGQLVMPPVALWAVILPSAVFLLWPPSRQSRYKFRDRAGCREAAQSHIAKGAELVIMGHTHFPEDSPLGQGRYLNPGAFSFPTPKGRPFTVVENLSGAPVARVDTLAPSG